MRNVCICHEQAVVADACLLALARRAVHGCTLADGGPVTDECIAFFALEFQILRHLADGRTLEYVAVTTDLGPLLDHNVRADLRSLTDLNMVRDDRIRTDLHVSRNARCRCNDSGFMDIGKNLAAACHLSQLLQPHTIRGRHFPLSVRIRQKRFSFTSENQP